MSPDNKRHTKECLLERTAKQRPNCCSWNIYFENKLPTQQLRQMITIYFFIVHQMPINFVIRTLTSI